jgi:hypothetical protein
VTYKEVCLNKTVNCFLVIFTIFSFYSTAEEINVTILDNFNKNFGDIIEIFEYFSGPSTYIDDTGYSGYYADEMNIYSYELSMLPMKYNHIVRNSLDISVELFNYIDHIIKLYKKTISLKVLNKYKELYDNTGLGETGHENFLKILSILYFWTIESGYTDMDDFPQEKHETIRMSIVELKILFNKQEWDTAVNYFINKGY